MDLSFSNSAPPNSLTAVAGTIAIGSKGPEELATQMAWEMADRWCRGERPQVEEFLNRHPELWAQPQAAARLVYEEICLRREQDAAANAQDVLARFPQWRAQLELLLDCQQLIDATPTAPAFPKVGQILGDFHLTAELGRGALGRVFLAKQLSLNDRQVVLKLSPCDTREHHEHLSLARLQHTHIVPLYAMQDFPEQNVRLLCMPFFGGVTLDRISKRLHDKPFAQRAGKDLLEALDQSQVVKPDALVEKSPGRQVLAEASYVRAVCMIGACLADALHYAHLRELVHLDLKPANILLTADGQPMLLDFHLAQKPLREGRPAPTRMGGTPLYMSPEQEKALAAVREGRALPGFVDGRSDIYSLGLVLYHLLGGPIPVDIRAPSQLRQYNPQVSVGLADILHKCMVPSPLHRYADAAALAEDLERHLKNQPLRHAPNRNLAERWTKWRHREPMALTRIGVMLIIFTVALTLGRSLYGRLRSAEGALATAQALLVEGKLTQAFETVKHGRSLLSDLRPLAGVLPRVSQVLSALDEQARVAEQAQASADQASFARALHALADQARFDYSSDSLPIGTGDAFEKPYRAFWEQRQRIVEHTRNDSSPEAKQMRADLLDIGIIWADLCVRLQVRPTLDESRREALRILADTEEMFGPSAVLLLERQSIAEASGLRDVARAAGARAAEMAPRTGWEHYALGRFLLRSGKTSEAATHFDRAVELDPLGFWPNFYQARCAHGLGRHDKAISAFSVCIGLSQEPAKCFCNRGLAYEALGEEELALADYGRALILDANLAAAFLNRGVLHLRRRRFAEAQRDLEAAGCKGADPVVVERNLSLIRRRR